MNSKHLTPILILSLIVAPYATISCVPKTPVEVQSPTISTLQVRCTLPNGSQNSGTVTVLKDSTYITSAHLFDDDCVKPTIGTRKFKLAHLDRENDIAILGSGRNFSDLSCENLPFGAKINAYGYANGHRNLTHSKGKVSNSEPSHHQWAQGFVEVGMSGGPVISDNNPELVHGIIKAKLIDGSAFQYVNGPTLCASIARLKD